MLLRRCTVRARHHGGNGSSPLTASTTQRARRRGAGARAAAASDDHYAVLNVDPSATQTEIKRAYRRAALRLHPDVNGSFTAAEEFKACVLAYETLSDATSRRRYDGERAAALQQQRRRRATTSSSAFSGAGWYHRYTSATVSEDQMDGQAFDYTARPGENQGQQSPFFSWGEAEGRRGGGVHSSPLNDEDDELFDDDRTGRRRTGSPFQDWMGGGMSGAGSYHYQTSWDAKSRNNGGAAGGRRQRRASTSSSSSSSTSQRQQQQEQQRLRRRQADLAKLMAVVSPGVRRAMERAFGGPGLPSASSVEEVVEAVQALEEAAEVTGRDPDELADDPRWRPRVRANGGGGGDSGSSANGSSGRNAPPSSSPLTPPAGFDFAGAAAAAAASASRMGMADLEELLWSDLPSSSGGQRAAAAARAAASAARDAAQGRQRQQRRPPPFSRQKQPAPPPSGRSRYAPGVSRGPGATMDQAFAAAGWVGAEGEGEEDGDNGGRGFWWAARPGDAADDDGWEDLPGDEEFGVLRAQHARPGPPPPPKPRTARRRSSTSTTSSSSKGSGRPSASPPTPPGRR
jgi:curved DNA-binding protein CbpA